DRVVLEQVRGQVDRQQVVRRDELDIRPPLLGGAIEVAPDPSEPVDADPDRHGILPNAGGPNASGPGRVSPGRGRDAPRRRASPPRGSTRRAPPRRPPTGGGLRCSRSRPSGTTSPRRRTPGPSHRAGPPRVAGRARTRPDPRRTRAPV